MVTCNLGFLAVHVPVSARYTSFWPIPLDSFSYFPGLLTFLSPPGLFLSQKTEKRTSTGFILYSQPALFIFLIYILFSCISITHLHS